MMSTVSRRVLVISVGTGALLLFLLLAVEREVTFSIGVFEGPSLHDLRPVPDANPILTASSVTDAPAVYVADPFMIRHAEKWYAFFEVKRSDTNQGDIGLASSGDGARWSYVQIVLDEPFHLAYPHVFKYGGDFYMIPDGSNSNSVRLYVATEFPHDWTFVGALLTGFEAVDPTPFYANDRWWLFLADRQNDTLRLFLSSNLLDGWHEHPSSPLIDSDANIARPAGRVAKVNGEHYRLTQDCNPGYGNKVRAFRITRLDRFLYEEERSGIVLDGGGSDWRRKGMHHLDAHAVEGGVMAIVDGKQTRASLFGRPLPFLSWVYDILFRTLF